VSDEKSNDKIETVDSAMLPFHDNHYAFMSGVKNRVTLVNLMPVIDCHVHIQSNNCAPMPLQWALVREAAARIIDPEGIRRKFMNVFSASIMEFGSVGRLGTDYVAKLFMNDMAMFNVKSDLLWTFINKSALKEFEKLRKEVEKLIVKNENQELNDREKQELKENIENLDQTAVVQMMQKRDREYRSLHEYAAYYFFRHKTFHMCTILPMDMSYAHYWGEFGIPVCLPFTDKKGKNCYYFIDEDDHIRLTINEKDRPVKSGNSHVIKNFYTDDSVLDVKVKLEYDIDIKKCNETLKDVIVLDAKSVNDEGKKSSLYEINSKKYKHFLKPVKAETDETFEDYRRQLKNTMTAGVLYPFEMFPFYHYDPRRHNFDQIEKVLNDIKTGHAFLEAKTDNFNSVKIKEVNVLNDLKSFFLENNYRTSEIINWLLPETKENSFFGIKIYPKLGYAPYDYDRYPQLKEFFSYCAQNKVPITVHCDPKGMTIADSHIYLKEAIKNKDNYYDKVISHVHESRDIWDFSNKDPYSLEDSHRYVNEIGTNPLAWKKALESYDLKINFAHFGGLGYWIKDHGKTKGKNRQFWIDDIIELMNKREHVYTDLAYLIVRWNNIKEIAENLTKKINENPVLKKRILLGSDWYMIERELFYSPGVDVYYRKIFEVLKRVSEKVGFDAWYYFTVENPLRFLGFIEDNNDKISDCQKAMDKFNAHKEYILNKKEDKKFLFDAGISNFDMIEEKIDRFLGSKEKKKYAGCKNPIEYKGYVNILDLKDIRDMKDPETGELLINKKPNGEDSEEE